MITRIDPSGMPDKLRIGVERANQLLEMELEKLTPYEFEAEWRAFGHEAGGLMVKHTLTALGETEPVSESITFHPGYFMGDDFEATRKSLKNLVGGFVDRLWIILRKDVRQLRTRLSHMATVGEE